MTIRSLSYTNTIKAFTATFDDAVVLPPHLSTSFKPWEVQHPQIVELVGLVDALSEATNRLTNLTLEVPVPSSPLEYRYKFTTTNGRTWKQWVRWSVSLDDQDPPSDGTFDGFKRTTEIPRHIIVLNKIVDMIRVYGLRSLSVNYF